MSWRGPDLRQRPAAFVAWLLGVMAFCGGTACGEASSPDGTDSERSCPADTSPRLSSGASADVWWCMRPSGIAHGPHVATDRASGVVVESGTWSDGRPHGAWDRFYAPVGIQRQHLEYRDGVPHGTWTSWDLLGRLEAEQTWSAGAPCGTWREYESGSVVLEFDFAACDDGLGEPGPALPRTPAAPPWDGAECAVGTRATSDRDGGTVSVQCLVDGVANGPALHLDQDDNLIGYGPMRDGEQHGEWAFVGLDPVWLERRVTYADGVLDGPSTAWHTGGGEREAGAYRDGARDGTWTSWRPDGSLEVVEEYARGALHGDRMVYWPSGAILSSETWAQGVRDGAYAEEWPDGAARVEGRFAAGHRDGPWRAYHPGGTLARDGEFARGLQNGTWRFFDAQQRETYRVTYEQGTPVDAVETFYDPLGTIEVQGAFMDGRRHGRWFGTWEDGAAALESTWLDGKLEGDAGQFWPDGSPRITSRYSGGLLHGPYRMHHENGQLAVEGGYLFGAPAGTWRTYTEDGVMTYQGTYEWNGLTIDQIVLHDGTEVAP